MSRFGESVLSRDREDRRRILAWLDAALHAIEPERLTRDAIAASGVERASLIAIGKAAPAMTRGAAAAASIVGGLCVSDHAETVPGAVTVMIGDHPTPGEASLSAGKAALRVARTAPGDIPLIGLISGGGSALCEAPRPGVPDEYVRSVHRTLVHAGANIKEINLVRGHLSSVKSGGLARARSGAIDTYVISDVAGADPGVVASGPTMPRDSDPERARMILDRYGIDVTPEIWQAMQVDTAAGPMPKITLLADGLDAGIAVANATSGDAEVRSEWLEEDVESCLDSFFEWANSEISIAVGEPVLEVTGDGRGGRNTHAALLAARRIATTADVFVAFATDGVDGSAGAAGAIVDGATVQQGGDPGRAIAEFDSATYLESTGDLLQCEPTGTNVSDIWILWRRDRGHNVE